MTALILTSQQAEALYGGNVPPDALVLVDPPARWPLDKPWPPKVTLATLPCWRCATRPARVSPLARYFAEHPLAGMEFQ